MARSASPTLSSMPVLIRMSWSTLLCSSPFDTSYCLLGNSLWFSSFPVSLSVLRNLLPIWIFVPLLSSSQSVSLTCTRTFCRHELFQRMSALCGATKALEFHLVVRNLQCDFNRFRIQNCLSSQDK